MGHIKAVVPRAEPEAIEAVTRALAARMGNRLVTSQAVRDQHAHSCTWLQPQPPDAVVYPQDSADVTDVVQICATHRVPIIPFGVGTSLEGQINAPGGGVSLDFRDMNRVLAVHNEDLTCTVEPGITRKQLNEHLRDQGLFFPIDPGADATIGGMAATRASGTNAVRYGTMRDNVVSMKVVRADGQTFTTATRARKSSAGYDLTRLFVGSEGTLGVTTELTIKLYGIPEVISSGVCPFPSVEDACNAVILTIQSGIPVARIELLDDVQVKACNAYSKLTLPEVPMLFVEFHGTDEEVAIHARRFGEIASDCGGGPFECTTKPEDRKRLWQAREDAYWAARSLRPGTDAIVTDACVPISRLAECVASTQQDLRESNLVSPIVGHVGDGNFHLTLLFDKNDSDEKARADAVIERLVKRAQGMEGTCTGEHGIGQGKQKYLLNELGPEALETMRMIKKAFDPGNILNPGKILSLL